jgi:GT2 family glycosyltransferase/glycosyltransferase involved in cell wall biosynthesis
LERQHAAVLNSTIWRATRPLRKVLQAAPPIRRGLSGVFRSALGEPVAGSSSMQPAIPGEPPRGLKATLRGWVSRTAGYVRRTPALHRTARRVAALGDRISPGLSRRVRIAADPARLEPARETHAVAPPEAARLITDRYLVVEFVWSATARPADFGRGPDTRQIAAGFAELVIRDPATPDAPPLAAVDFRTNGNSLTHALYGFSFIEPWGTWTSGGRSGVLVWLPNDAPQTCTLEVRAGVFDAAFKTVDCEVIANGAHQGHITLDGGEPGLLMIATAAPGLSTIARENNVSLDADAKPEVSIIILNYNKPLMTFVSVMSILASATKHRYEIVVLDNGSSPDNVAMMAELKLPARLVTLRANRFFGEGNNIAAEHARAPLFLFLNNDAFLTDGALDALMEPLADPSVGIVGPVFRYPDRSIQEAGAFINPDGTALQRGKYNPDFDVASLRDIEPVDYVSAACLLISAEDFYGLGGFDLRYDPAYYEDSDLCLRLLALGKKTVVATRANTLHVENATTSDPRNKSIATAIVDRHRQIFLSRWGQWLENRVETPLPAIERFDYQPMLKAMEDGRLANSINSVYTPFPLVQGGGERYILGVAQAMSRLKTTAVTTPDEYSGLRLNTLVRELGFAPYQLFTEIERKLAQRAVDRFVLMGNELLPTRAGYGDRRVYHCQFPFPNEVTPATRRLHVQNLAAYETVVVNSQFTRDAYLRELFAGGLASAPRLEIIPPPVRLIASQTDALGQEREDIIVCIGRFTTRGHAKRQDAVLQAYTRLMKSGRLSGWRLILAGVVPNEPDAIAYYQKLEAGCEEAPGAELMLAPSRSQIEALLGRAKVYVSATGFGVDGADEDWKREHFGITVVEAASAGCVPVAHRSGGPVEIVGTLGGGFLFTTLEDLETAILDAAAAADDRALRAQIVKNSAAYSEDAFARRWTALITET